MWPDMNFTQQLELWLRSGYGTHRRADEQKFMVQIATREGMGMMRSDPQGRLRQVLLLCLVAACCWIPAALQAQEQHAGRFIDLSLMDSPQFPCTWPGPEWPVFQINQYLRIGPLSAYNSDILI